MVKEVIILEHIVITPLLKAQATFNKALLEPKTDLNRDGCIQRFEFCFELAWKTLKRILAYKGIEVNNPRDVFREAARSALVDDPAIWFKFLESRNNTVHTYNEETAEEIYKVLPRFKEELAKLVDTICAL